MKRRLYARKTPVIDDDTCEGRLWLIRTNLALQESGFKAKAINTFSVLMQERVEVEVLEDIGIGDRVAKFQIGQFKLDVIFSIANICFLQKVGTYP